MSLQEQQKVCWVPTCDHCGDGDGEDGMGSYHYESRDEALKAVVGVEWIEQDGLLFCAGCIENVDYPYEGVEKAVASLIEKVRAERADGSSEHSTEGEG